MAVFMKKNLFHCIFYVAFPEIRAPNLLSVILIISIP